MPNEVIAPDPLGQAEHILFGLSETTNPAINAEHASLASAYALIAVAYEIASLTEQVKRLADNKEGK